jgi:hypothetical protein
MSGLRRTEGIGPCFLCEVLQEFAASDAEENMEKIGEGIPRSVRELLLVAQNQADPETESTEKPLQVTEGAQVKPSYLEYMRARDSGQTKLTWQEWKVQRG